MKVLLDRCVPKRLTFDLVGFDSVHASDVSWGGVSNGALTRAASEGGFAVLVTVDQDMRHQTNIEGLEVGVLVIEALNNRLSTLRAGLDNIQSAIPRVMPGEYLMLKLTG